MSKKVCIIHTETTGLHELPDEKVYKKNLFGFARMVSFSWIIASKDTEDKITIIKKQKFIIKPRCLQIPNEIVQFHGISQEIALEKGTEIEEVLDLFKTDLVGVSIIVSHSLNFHLKTVQAELVRYNKAMNFNKYDLFDINSFEHNISPATLQNLCQKLINKDLKDKTLVIDYICELFFKLYNKYKNEIKPKEDEINSTEDEIKPKKRKLNQKKRKLNQKKMKLNRMKLNQKKKKLNQKKISNNSF